MRVNGKAKIGDLAGGIRRGGGNASGFPAVAFRCSAPDRGWAGEGVLVCELADPFRVA